MKKVLVVVAAMAFVTAIMSSCHRHGSCPAYGKVSNDSVERSV